TLQIAEKYKDKISKVVSEKDKGLYDALNKGIKHASGDIIGMLHSDDLYSNPQVLSKIVKTFQDNPDAEGVYADLVFVNRNDTDKVMRTWESGTYQEGDFLKGWMPPHPTFFVKKAAYEKHGGFNTELKLSADYELMLRLIHKNQIKLAYLNEVIVKMRMGGVSNVSFFVKLKANLEDKMAWKINGIKPKMTTMIMKPLRKLGQYLKRAYHLFFY
ncbi:MAG: glycosyltransferase, partial [Bacteroidia bacterium]|nr:glycosyltransferase [Bacteroidia bacterium]